MRWRVPNAVVLALALGCGGNGSGSGGSGVDAGGTAGSAGAGAAAGAGTGGGGGGGSGSGGAAGSGQCNDLQAAPPIPQCFVLEAPPVPSGGTIVPGLYHLTAITTYIPSGQTGCSSAEAPFLFSTALVGTSSWDEFHNLQFPVERHWSGSYTVEDVILKRAMSCPLKASASEGYTATPQKILVFWQVGSGGTSILEFTKQ